MNALTTTAVVFVLLLAAIATGVQLGRLLPTHHLTQDTKDTVKMAMGLVGTTVALLLGLLISSAKASYDTRQSEVIQTASKAIFLDRALSMYGPDTAETRHQLRSVSQEWVRLLWSGERSMRPQADSGTNAGDSIYFGILRLSPQSDTQRGLRDQATMLAIELGELRTLLRTQSIPSISPPLLIVVAAWLVVIFLGFSLIAPRNATSITTLVASALSVSGAIFLILELDQPFGGLIHISNQPMLDALRSLGS